MPLPSRKEKCMFTLKPITHTVGDFISVLKAEDLGIDRACVTTIGKCKCNFFFFFFNLNYSTMFYVIFYFFTDGTRIGSGNTIESLLDSDFKLVVNDVTYDVSPPDQEKYSMVLYFFFISSNYVLFIL